MSAAADNRRDWLAYGALLMAGAVLYVICREFPAELPPFLPWEFSWPVFLTTALILGWFVRGLRAIPKEARPRPWRIAVFVLGLLSIYAVLQTHIDYYAQHAFFVHRAQQWVLHHAGPFLIALGAAGPVVRAGMPRFVARIADWWPLQRVVDVMQHPAVAPVLFVGLLYFWLMPAIHTPAMLDRDIYDVMNWSMAINGIFFWWLILDPRPTPPARISALLRMGLILVIELPQMLLGAILSLSTTDYYPVYKICGRILPVAALSDQHYGGLIIWLPGTMMSLAAMIVVLINLRLNEERAEHARQGSTS
jgi:putative membrane protein